MNNVKNVYFPTSVKEALNFLKMKNSFFINAGTFSFKNLGQDVENVVLGKYLPLKYIKKDKKNLIIGANSTFDDLENNAFCKKLFSGFISKVASFCSSQLIRNMATVGGNIAKPNAFNLIPVINATLDAKITLVTKMGKKTVNWQDLYSQKHKIGKDCLISEIIYPIEYNNHNFYFEKVSKLNSSWESYLTVGFRSLVKNRKIKDIRLVFGAIRAIPYVNYEFEKTLIGKELTLELINEIANEYEKNILNLNPNSQLSVYRANVAKNLINFYFQKLMEQ